MHWIDPVMLPELTGHDVRSEYRAAGVGECERRRGVAGGEARRRPASGHGGPFELRSARPVEIGIAGEAIVLGPLIRFRILPGVLRVRIRPRAPATPPMPPHSRDWAAITALLQTTSGRPVAIPS